VANGAGTTPAQETKTFEIAVSGMKEYVRIAESHGSYTAGYKDKSGKWYAFRKEGVILSPENRTEKAV